MPKKALNSSMAPRLINAPCSGNYATIFMTFVHSSRNTNASAKSKSEHRQNVSGNYFTREQNFH